MFVRIANRKDPDQTASPAFLRDATEHWGGFLECC